MSVQRFEHVCLESFAVSLPGESLPGFAVTSDEIEARLAESYARLSVPMGSLQRLSGVQRRLHFDKRCRPSDGAAAAAEQALAGIGFDRSLVGTVLNCSISRDYFEPATAVFVHDRLGLPGDGVVMDISNACAGFSNGIATLAGMIEAGVVRAGVVVACETMEHIASATERALADPGCTRDDFLQLLPSLTLGSGAAAFVLCHDSVATRGHRIRACASRSATALKDLCKGNGDVCFHTDGLNPLMRSDTAGMLEMVVPLGEPTWRECLDAVGWQTDDLDHIVTHQIGRMADEAMVRRAGLDPGKNHTIYEQLGNQAAAALPTAMVLAAEVRGYAAGDKVLMIGFGSGFVAAATAVEW